MTDRKAQFIKVLFFLVLQICRANDAKFLEPVEFEPDPERWARSLVLALAAKERLLKMPQPERTAAMVEIERHLKTKCLVGEACLNYEARSRSIKALLKFLTPLIYAQLGLTALTNGFVGDPSMWKDLIVNNPYITIGAGAAAIVTNNALIDSVFGKVNDAHLRELAKHIDLPTNSLETWQAWFRSLNASVPVPTKVFTNSIDAKNYISNLAEFLERWHFHLSDTDKQAQALKPLSLAALEMKAYLESESALKDGSAVGKALDLAKKTHDFLVKEKVMMPGWQSKNEQKLDLDPASIVKAYLRIGTSVYGIKSQPDQIFGVFDDVKIPQPMWNILKGHPLLRERIAYLVYTLRNEGRNFALHWIDVRSASGTTFRTGIRLEYLNHQGAVESLKFEGPYKHAFQLSGPDSESRTSAEFMDELVKSLNDFLEMHDSVKQNGTDLKIPALRQHFVCDRLFQ